MGRLTERVHRYRDIMKAVKRHGPVAMRDSGKSLLAQALEIAALRSGIGKLEPDEYYNYGLYDDRRFTRREKEQFLGRRLEEDLVPRLLTSSGKLMSVRAVTVFFESIQLQVMQRCERVACALQLLRCGRWLALVSGLPTPFENAR